MAAVGGSQLLQEFIVHQVDVPPGLEDIDGSSTCLALVVLQRQTGALLAIPTGVLSPDVLAAGLETTSEDQVGMSTNVTLPAGSVSDLAASVMPTPVAGAQLDVVLVDVPQSFLETLIPFAESNVPFEVVHTFNFDDPMLVPLPSELVQATWDWIQDPGSAQLIGFYSAAEEEVVPETPGMNVPAPSPKRVGRQRAPQPNGGPGAKQAATPAKRPTVAQLASALDQVSVSLPAMVSQLENLARRQDAMEAHLHKEVSRPSALQQPLGQSAMHGLSTASATAKSLIREFPPPSRSSPTPGNLLSGPSRVGQPEAVQLEEERQTEMDSSDLAKAVLAQSQALTTLVTHLANGDPIGELSAGSSSISTKGAQGRARLQQELAAQRGTFFQSVLQSMARRMQPARPAEQSPQELALRGVVPTSYLERFGGYGRARDLGCLQWQVMMILDHLQQENIPAAKDTAALLAVCIEQSAMDSGRLDIGMLLSLSEDPPAGIFQSRATTSYAKGRAFAPLAEQRWVTVALAYIKEMDLIAAKRQDAAGGKNPDKDSDTTPAQTALTCHDLQSKQPCKSHSKETTKEEAKGRRKAKPECASGGGVKAPLKVKEFLPDFATSTTTVPKVLAAMPRWILTTRTMFAAILARTFHIQPRGVSSPTVVFPLPLMDFNLFSKGHGRLCKKKWIPLLRRRLVHMVIVALNYLEGALSMSNIHLLGRQPNGTQKKIHSRLLSLCTTCDLSGDLQISMVPGRSGLEFIDALNSLEQFAKRNRLFEVKGYSEGPSDFEKCAVGKLRKEDGVEAATAMYTSLNAQRLRLVGQGKWRVQDHLHDELWLPYVEPKVLRHYGPIDYALGPNLGREDKDEYLALARKWSSLGLLALTEQPPHAETFTRIFNCYKSAEHDRQIGDRRLANAAEFAITGPSKFLPSGFLITNIEVPKGRCVYGAITDRKDFYHQCAASYERAVTNVLPFAYPQSYFENDPALKHLWALKHATGKDRLKTGDNLGGIQRSILSKDDPVFPCFQSLLQGDHLGVEVALSGHGALLQDAGLLWPSRAIKGGHVFPLGPDYEGLVIDDYFSLSVSCPSSAAESSVAVENLRSASAAYEREGVLGSPEKDVIGSKHFKVVGAEVDTSDRVVALGRAIVSAPLQKRVALAVLSLRVAQLPIVSAELASRLSGNWTSIFMFRRCLSCILDEFYKYGSVAPKSGKEVFDLSRKAAEELVLASVLSFVAISDVSARYSRTIYASDASLAKGAFCAKEISSDLARVMWLGGDKKGAYTRLDPPFRELCKIAGLDDYVEDAVTADAVHAPIKVPRCLEFSFDFLEICAGVGSVSKELAKLGFQVCTPIELTDSPHFDVTSLDLINWICNMIKGGRLRAIMVEPVCTTFSAAAYPALRSYRQPKGFNRLCPRTHVGNVIAFRCLFLLWYAARWSCPALGEQPRLSKMAWLSVWRMLIDVVGFREAIVASCQFGSPHRKEFRMIGKNLDMDFLDTRCPGGHAHIRIQGRYTKASAVYTPALAAHIAKAFANALRVQHHVSVDEIQVTGIESVVANDILLSGNWRVVDDWHWQRASHINLLESSAYLKVLRSQLENGGDLRFTTLLDSRVAKCSHAKGRSSARALAPSLKRGAALQIAGGLYPALGFAPTRLNVADAPTREKELPSPCDHSLISLLDLRDVQFLHSISISRPAAGWVRLVILAYSLHCCDAIELQDQAPSVGRLWIFPPTFKFWCIGSIVALAFAVCCLALCVAVSCYGYHPSSICLRASSCAWDLPSHLAWHESLSINGIPPPRRGAVPSHRHLSWIFIFGLIGFVLIFGQTFNPPLASLAIYIYLGGLKVTLHEPQPLPLACFLFGAEAMPLNPADRSELRRAERRAATTLTADRVIRPQTRSRRDILLEQFNGWLMERASLTVQELVDDREADPEVISNWLVMYGKELFYAGKPYGRFSETINAIGSRRPCFRRQLVAAWDLAFSWVADEPTSHHPAMPLPILLAISTLALLWGWARESSLFLLSWCGVLRIGEALNAKRKDLVLPCDGVPGRAFALLQIQQPKTRGTAAKHQAARIDPGDVVRLLTSVFGKIGRDEMLWQASSAVLRRRFTMLQKALGLTTVRSSSEIPYDLASLRPGGATHLLHRFEDAEFVRRRGRWLSSRVCEVYLQEVAIATYANHLTPEVQQRIQKLAASFTEVLEKALHFLDMGIPPIAWPKLW